MARAVPAPVEIPGVLADDLIALVHGCPDRPARSCWSSAWAGSAATTRPAVSAAKLEPPAQQLSSTVGTARSAGVRPNMSRYSAADLDEMIMPAPDHDGSRHRGDPLPRAGIG